MRRSLRERLRRARRQVMTDLATDPYLRYILLLSAILSVFWIWHRVPNFATRDERWRVVDPFEILAYVLENPSIDGIRDGLSHWRPYGATLYLYGIVVLPVVLLALAVGEIATFADLTDAYGRGGLFGHWEALPGWIWSSSIVAVRLTNVVLAVGCVYMVYRIGTKLRDRATGRLAALLLALTWIVIVLAHEAGEDIPALFCLLVVYYLALRYLETGDAEHIVVGAGVTGLAMAFKLTAGLGAVFLVVAYLLRAKRSGDFWKAIYRPTLIKRSVALGALVLVLGFPSVFAEGPDLVLQRIGRGVSAKSTPHGWIDRPTWWWLIRGYLNAFGWPLFVGAIGGVAAALARLRERSFETDGVIVTLSVLGFALAVFSLWSYMRSHHLLPTIPLFVVLLAVALQRLADRRRTVARVLMAGLLVSTAVYAGVGTVGYASQPRDGAVSYITANAGPDATVETYPWDPQEAAVPLGMNISHWSDPGQDKPIGPWILDLRERCPDFVVLNHQRAMLYLAPANHSVLASEYADPQVDAFFSDLLTNESDAYEIAGRFGPEPVFLETGQPRDSLWNLVQAGINPRSIQYGDPQDFGVDQFAIVLERTGTCSVPATGE